MVLICRNYCIWCVINFWDFIVKLDEFMVITLVVHFIFDARIHVGVTKNLEIFEVSKSIDVMLKGK